MGLSTLKASELVIEAIHEELEKEEDRLDEDPYWVWTLLWSRFWEVETLYFLCACALWGVALTREARTSTTVLALVVLVVFEAIGAGTTVYRAWRLRWEVVERVQDAADAFSNAIEALLRANSGVAGVRGGGFGGGVGLGSDGVRLAPPFSHHFPSKAAKLALTYRDERWVRLPPVLLAVGDVVALQRGEIAPADVVCMDVLPGMSHPRVQAGEVVKISVPRGGRGGNDVVLGLCNDLRRFEVQSAPVRDELRASLRSPQRPLPALVRETVAAEYASRMGGILVMVLGLVGFVVWGVLENKWMVEEMGLLCAVLSRPAASLGMFLIDSLANGRVLAVIELATVRSAWRRWREALRLRILRATGADPMGRVGSAQLRAPPQKTKYCPCCRS